MFKINTVKLFSYFKNIRLIFYFIIFLFLCLILNTEYAFSSSKNKRVSINGSGLKIPRIVSLKNSLTYMRSGPGKEFPIIFELNQRGYPLKITAEFNNWRKVITHNNISGWIHTQLLSSIKTGLITEKTFLKTTPSDSGKSIAKLLPNLLFNIKKCEFNWCKVEIIKINNYVGWVKKDAMWGYSKN